MLIGVVSDVINLVVDDNPHVGFRVVSSYLLPGIQCLRHLLKSNIIDSAIIIRAVILK